MATKVDELRARFKSAADHLPSLVSSLSPQELLEFYGYYKQATSGKCNTARPNWYAFEAKQKWDAWNNLGDMEKEEAMRQYIQLMSEICPDWETDSKSNGWVSVSTLQNSDVDLSDNDKDIFDRVKEGDIDKVNSFEGDVNALDDEGMGLIHWAADRGNVDMVECLLDLGADINLIDSSGQTALHYAAACGHANVVSVLLNRSADTNVICNEGLKPVDVADDLDTIKLIQASI